MSINYSLSKRYTLPAVRLSSSTTVETALQISSFLTNKPNFPYFSPKNEDCAKKQTQYKPKQSQFWANFKAGKAKQSQFKANFTHDVSLLALEFTLGCAYLFSTGGRVPISLPLAAFIVYNSRSILRI
jgi:hypothetical protein